MLTSWKGAQSSILKKEEKSVCRSCAILWPDLRLPLSSWIEIVLLSSFLLFGNKDPEPKSDLIPSGRSMQ